MSFKAAKCPNCAGDLQLPDDRDTVKCMYCGSDIIVREAIKLAGGVNIENLLMLAKNAEDAGNNDEAYKYYSTVLEYDPTNVTAWIGKGMMPSYGTSIKSGEQFITVGSDHLKTCLSNALAFAVDKEQFKKDLLKIIERDFNNLNYKARDFFIEEFFIEELDTNNVKRIIDWLIAEFKKDHGIDLSKDSDALKRLKDAAVKARIELSIAMETEINLPFIDADATGAKHIEIRLSRDKLEHL